MDSVKEKLDLLKKLANEKKSAYCIKDSNQQFIDHQQQQQQQQDQTEKVQQEIINSPQQNSFTTTSSKPSSSNIEDKNDNLNKDLTIINGFENEHKQKDTSEQHKNKLSLLNSNTNNNNADLENNNKFESNLNNNNKLETNTESITPVGLLIENKEERKDNTEKTNNINNNSTKHNDDINNSKDLEVVLEEEEQLQQKQQLQQESKDSADCKLNQMKFLQPNLKTNPLDSRTRSVSIDNSNLKLKLPGQIDNIYFNNNNTTISSNHNNFHNPNNYNNINFTKHLNSNNINNINPISSEINNQNDLTSYKTLPSSKYIRKIQDTIYDRERASSTESIHKLLNNNTNNSNYLTPNSSFKFKNAPIALPEEPNETNLPSDLDLNDSISLSQQQQQQQQQQQHNKQTIKYSDLSLPNSKLNNNKYVKYLRNLQQYNTTNNNKNTPTTRSDSMDNLKRTNSLIRPDQSFIRSDQLMDKMPSTLSLINSNGYYNSQIDKIREKFAKISEKTTPPILSITPAPALLSPNIITNISNSNNNTNYTNTTNLIINRSNNNHNKTNDTDNPITSIDNNHINITNNLNITSTNTTTSNQDSLNDNYYNNNNYNKTATLSTANTTLLKKDSPKTFRKYQKSKTSDLSEYLFENEIYNHNNTNTNSNNNNNNNTLYINKNINGNNNNNYNNNEIIDNTPTSASSKLDLLDPDYQPRKTSIKSILKSPSSTYDTCFEDIYNKRTSVESEQFRTPPALLVKPYLNEPKNRIFVKSPTPVREIPVLEEEQQLFEESNLLFSNDINDFNTNSKNNRNRFQKKKPSLRSKSVEFSLSLLNLNDSDLLTPNYMPNPNTRELVNMQSQYDEQTRPNLMRQNALAKSLGENLDKIPNESQMRPVNNPIITTTTITNNNRNNKPHSHHRHRYSRYHRSKRNNNQKTSSFSSTSLTSSSTSYSSDSSYEKYRNDPKKNSKSKPIDNIRLNRKHEEKYNYSSDDSVCGIPKRRSSHRLCTNGKPFHKSMDDFGYRANTTSNQANENSLNEQDAYYSTRSTKSNQMDTLNYLDTTKFKSSNNANNVYKANPPNNLNMSTSINNLNNSTSTNANNFYMMKKSPINENQSFTTARTYRDASLNSLNTNANNNKFNYNNNSNFTNSQSVDKQLNSNMSQKVLPQHMSLRNINESGNNGLIQGPNSMSTGLMKNADVSFMKNNNNNNNNFSSNNNYMLQNNSNNNFYSNQSQQSQPQPQKQLPTYSQLSIPNAVMNQYNQSKQFNTYGSSQFQPQQQLQQPQLNKSSSLIPSTSPLQYYDNKNDTKNYDSWVKEKRVVSVSPSNIPITPLSGKPLMNTSSTNGSQTALNSSSPILQQQKSSKIVNAPITNKNVLPSNKTFNLYSLLNPHQRITQPYQQLLLNHVNLTKEEQELEEQSQKQLPDKETDATTAAASTSQQKRNQLNYQKTISKSFDSSSLNPSNDENKNNGNDLTNKLYQQKQYHSTIKEVKEEEMPQASAAMQERLKRFESQDTAKINANYENIKQNKYFENQEKQNKTGLIEDAQKFNTLSTNGSNSTLNRKKSPFETNKENSPISTSTSSSTSNSNKPTQFNSQQTHTFQPVQPQNNNALKRPVTINAINDGTAKTTMTFPFQSNVQPNQQQPNYYYNSQNKTQPQPQQSNSITKLTDVNSSPSRVVPPNYKYSQLTAPYSNSTTAVSPINLIKPTNYFQKASSPPNQVNTNLANATSAAAEALKQQERTDNQLRQQQQQQLNPTKQDNVSMIPKSPSQAFNTNYEIIQSSWGNSNNDTSNSNSSSSKPKPVSSPQPEYLPDQFIPARVSKRAALFEQQKLQDEYKKQLDLHQKQQQSLSPPNQSLDTSKTNSFNKSSVSPAKLTQTTTSNLTKTQEDVELLSSSSSSSYKENFKRNNNNNKNQEEDLSSQNEPSKLSMSEKMKLFSNSNTTTSATNSANTISKLDSSRSKSQSKRTMNNRFQTQPISQAEVEYASDNIANKNIDLNKLNDPSSTGPTYYTSNKLATFSIPNNTNLKKAVFEPIQPQAFSKTLKIKTIKSINISSSSESTTSTSSASTSITTSPSSLTSSSSSLFNQKNAFKPIQSSIPTNSNQSIDSVNKTKSNSSFLLTHSSNQLVHNLPFSSTNNNHKINYNSNRDTLIRSNKNISFDLVNKSRGGMDSAAAALQQEESVNDTSRDIKRYKTRSKTDDTSLLTSNHNSEFNNENMEKKSNELDNGEVVIMSIQERMAALRKSGEEDWKRRNAASSVTNQQGAESNETNSTSIAKQQQQIKQQMQISGANKPMGKLNLSSELKRAILAPLNDNVESEEEKSKNLTKYDNETNENNETSAIPAESTKREKRLPVGAKIIFNPSDLNADLEKALLKNKANKSKTQSSETKSVPSSSSQQLLNERVELFSTDSEMDSFFKENDAKNYKYADLFSSSSAVGSPQNDDLENNEDEFDRIVSDAQRLTQGVRPKPTRRAKSKGNHLKNLHNRIEIKNEYEQNHVPLINSQTELGSHHRSNEKTKSNQKVNKKENLFTESAMAGLAAKEDYTAVKLKRSDSMTHVDDYPPFSDLMLLSIKGRRYCQVRLVEPCIESLNNSDCFILVAPNRLFLWIGENANIIEKSKANELYDWIRLKKDLGIKSQTTSTIINSKSILNEEETNLSHAEKEFIKLLQPNSKKSISEISVVIQPGDEDEKYELLINDTNMVFKVAKLNETDESESCVNYNDENVEELSNYCLQPIENYWGRILSYNMLDENDVFVFDFGSEVYIWSGRNAKRILKKSGSLLAKKLFESGYDYTNCKFTPLKPNLTDNFYETIYYKSAGSRPRWTLFGRQKQNAETCLFRSKFIDWPNQTNNPALKKLNYNGVLKTSESAPESPQRKPYQQHQTNSDNDVTKNIFNFEPLNETKLQMIIKQRDEQQVNLILEQSCLGRGRHWFDEIERRSYDIVTEKVTMWQIHNNELIECSKNSLGELYSNFTYVVKWHYKVNAVGFRALKGGLSQHQGITGRDRYALFFWHGQNSTNLEKGSGALLSLELTANISNVTGSNETNESTPNLFSNDKRSMPHIQVYQHKEIAAFNQLFSGSMIIYSNENSNSNYWRMFELRGELEEESHLIEITPVKPDNLRSRSSFLFFNSSRTNIFIWHGCASSELHRKLIIICTEKLLKRDLFKQNHVEINEIEEGSEDELVLIKDVFNTTDRDFNTMYYSYLRFNKTNSELTGTPRLYLMTTLYGKFEVKEILNPLRSENVCPFPFFQFHLYEEKQPSIFMVDCENELYIWQGWFETPENSGENKNKIILNEIDATDGSCKIRFTLNRKCAYQTAINYWDAKYKNKEFKGYVVYAGLEPIEFTNLFPFWQLNENARNSNLNEGKKPNQKDNIMEILAQLNRNRYPAEILRSRPLPDGVNPLHLTDYLSDTEFEEIMHCTKTEFATLPAWKQTNLKKKANLF